MRQGAVRLHFEVANTGNPHNPADQAEPGDNFAADGRSCEDNPSAGAIGWDVLLVDDNSADAGITGAPGPRKVTFAGPKAKRNGFASRPTGNTRGAIAGENITLLYAPQRIRGCDGVFGRWFQQPTVTFFEARGQKIGFAESKVSFDGTGMIPASMPPVVMQMQMRQGAVRMHFEVANTGNPHNPSDQVEPGDNFAADGRSCEDNPSAAVIGWDIPLQ